MFTIPLKKVKPKFYGSLKFPSAASVRSGVENPRTGHDCEACDLNHGKSRAGGYP